jgi:cytochrome c oxidase subunit 3
MATIIQPPPVELEPDSKQVSDGGSGGGDSRNLEPNGPEPKSVDDRQPEPVRTGIWVGLASITMMFAALTSALFVREGSATDWHHLTLPTILYLNTLVLLASSVTLEIARRRVAGYMRSAGTGRSKVMFWLYATLVLGLAFAAGQYIAWQQLRAEGLYLSTNPNSSFFYLLTAVHLVHVLGGLCGLARVIHKLSPTVMTLRRSTMDATSYYWHFMGILWMYLLFVLWLKI